MRCLSVFLFVCATLRAGNGVQAGNFVVERPTLICLGFEWGISGDDNRNAAVDVIVPAFGRDRLEAGAATPADRRRAGLPRRRASGLHRARPFRRQHPGSRPRHGIRSAPQHEGPGRRHRAGRPNREGAHARRAQSRYRRPHAARLPARLEGPEAGARHFSA